MQETNPLNLHPKHFVAQISQVQLFLQLQLFFWNLSCCAKAYERFFLRVVMAGLRRPTPSGSLWSTIRSRPPKNSDSIRCFVYPRNFYLPKNISNIPNEHQTFQWNLAPKCFTCGRCIRNMWSCIRDNRGWAQLLNPEPICHQCYQIILENCTSAINFVNFGPVIHPLGPA